MVGELGQLKLSTIGHKLREALQDFVSALVQVHDPVQVNLDVAKTLDRLSAVIKQHHPGLSKRRLRLFDALFAYCRVAIEMVQRQEHGGQREGEPLEWEDGLVVRSSTPPWSCSKWSTC